MNKSNLKSYIILIMIITSACSKESSNPPEAPVVAIYGTSDYRSTTDKDFEFKISVAKAATVDISVDYATMDGTAIAGTDYVAASGKATITAGVLSTNIKVKVKADSLRRDHQTFVVKISNPTVGNLANAEAQGVIVNSDGLYFPVDNAGYSTPTSYPNYTLIWNDEFGGKSIDETNWTFESGGNGWGNQELEFYTNRTQNAFVSSGNLIIEARLETYNGSNYTSARMITKGKRSFRYGRIDIRAKLPKGQGIWPALWMLGSNIGTVGWPTCGEIDMMEMIGNGPSKIYGTLHWGPTHQSYGTNYTLNSGIFYDQFHVFSMVWDASNIKLYVDDNLYFTMDSSSNALPFNSDFFFIFNVAVGGDWPGSPDGTTQFPQRMIVDYVRVFQ